MKVRSSLRPELTPSMLNPAFSLPPSGVRQPDDTQARLIRLADGLLDLSVLPPAAVNNLAEINSNFSRNNRRLGSLEEKSYFSNLMVATLKEEQETAANKVMLNRVTVSGVEIENVCNMSESEKIRVMREKVAGIFEPGLFSLVPNLGDALHVVGFKKEEEKKDSGKDRGLYN